MSNWQPISAESPSVTEESGGDVLTWKLSADVPPAWAEAFSSFPLHKAGDPTYVMARDPQVRGHSITWSVVSSDNYKNAKTNVEKAIAHANNAYEKFLANQEDEASQQAGREAAAKERIYDKQRLLDES